MADDAPVTLTEEYRIVKESVPVTLVLEGGEVAEGGLYLLPHAARHAGRERVIDLLLAPEPFLPLRTPDGHFQLINKERVVLARVGAAEDAGLDEVPGVEVELTLQLATLPAAEREVRGTAHIAAPSPHGRLTDLLNEREPLLLLTGDQGPMIVNKRYVLRAVAQSPR